MSCTVCPDRASAKISIGKDKGKGTLLLCKSCYSHVNTSTIGANATIDIEKRVHIHKDSKVFAGLQFMASHLGEHFATVLDLPHNDLNLYKSTVKEAHYTLPLRVIHPIANGLGLIGMPNGRKRQLDDRDDPNARRVRTDSDTEYTEDPDDTPDLYNLDDLVPPSSSDVATSSSGTAAATSSSSSGGGIKHEVEEQSKSRSILESILRGRSPVPATRDVGLRPLPATAIAHIMSTLDLRSFLRMIKRDTIVERISHVTDESTVKKFQYRFDLAAIPSKTFCKVLGNTLDQEFRALSELREHLIGQLVLEKRMDLLYLLWLRSRWNIYSYLDVSVRIMDIADINRQYTVKLMAIDNELRYAGRNAETLSAELNAIQLRISASYIPVTEMGDVFSICHENIRILILAEYIKRFDFSTWTRSIMLSWCDGVVTSMLRQITVDGIGNISGQISSLCKYLIDNRNIFCGRKNPYTTDTLNFLDMATAVYDVFMPINAERAYNTVVNILEALAYWGNTEYFADLIVTHYRYPNTLAVNNGEHSFVRAILEVLRGTINRHTIGASPLNLMELLFNRLMPCSATLELYITHQPVISLNSLRNSIRSLLTNITQFFIESDVYDLHMRAISAILHRISRASKEEIESQTDLLITVGLHTISLNTESNILSCVTRLMREYIPVSIYIGAGAYVPDNLKNLILKINVPEMYQYCLGILQTVTLLIPNFNAEQTMLLLMSKNCGGYLFILNDFLKRNMYNMNEATMYDILANVVTSIVDVGFTRSDTRVAYQRFIEEFAQLVTLLGNSIEAVIKLDSSGLLIGLLATKIIVHTDWSLEKVFPTISPDLLQFCTAKYYIRTGNRERLQSILKTNDLSKYGLLFGKCIYDICFKNARIAEQALEILKQHEIDITLDEVNTGSVIALLRHEILNSFSNELPLCRTLFSSWIQYDPNIKKYIFVAPISETYTIVTHFLTDDRIKFLCPFFKLPLDELISVTDLPLRQQQKITQIRAPINPLANINTDKTKITFVAALDLVDAIKYVEAIVVDYVDPTNINIVSPSMQRKYARTLTEAMRYWLKLERNDVPTYKIIINFMKLWDISPLASLDQYGANPYIVNDLFEASWLPVLLDNAPLRLPHLFVGLYAYTMSQSGITFTDTVQNGMVHDFYNNYIPYLYQPEVASITFQQEGLPFEVHDICKIKKEYSARSIIRCIQVQADWFLHNNTSAMPYNESCKSLLTAMLLTRKRRTDDSDMLIFNECIKNIATLLYVRCIPSWLAKFGQIIRLKEEKFGEYALHEIMSTVATTVYDTRSKTIVEERRSERLIPLVYDIAAFLNKNKQFFTKKSPKHGNQTIMHLWLKSFFGGSALSIQTSKVITLCYKHSKDALLLSDDTGNTPVDVYFAMYQDADPNMYQPRYKKIKKIMTEMRLLLPPRASALSSVVSSSSSTPSPTLTTAAAAAAAALPPSSTTAPMPSSAPGLAPSSLHPPSTAAPMPSSAPGLAPSSLRPPPLLQ